MKTNFILLVALFAVLHLSAQTKLEITLDAESIARIELNGENVKDPKSIAIPNKENNKIIIKSAPNLNGWVVKIINDGGDDNTLIDNYKIPDNKTDVEFILTDGQQLRNGITDDTTNTYYEKIRIILTKEGLKKSLSVKVNFAGDDNANEGNTNDTKTSIKNNDQILYTFVENDITNNGYQYVTGQNIIYDRRGIVHIYLDENLKPIYSYFPTAAKSNYDNFQFHIIAPKTTLRNYKFEISSDGTFDPEEISDEVSSSAKATSGNKKDNSFAIYSFPILGPFTSTFPFTINKIDNKDQVVKSIDKQMKLLKTSRFSVNTGVVVTWLKNPENISTFVKPNKDTTLIADNPTTRGFLALVGTFHIKPRNLNIQPRSFEERLGFSVGTNINATAFNNFFFGLNIELTNGLFLNGGVHYGQVSYVVNYPHFNFGNDKFSGSLMTRKQWNCSPYVAINIDAALFAKVFKNILNPASNEN